MNIGFIGCGFASDGYVSTLRNHPRLRLVGVADQDRARAELFGSHYSVKAFSSNEALLDDPSIAIVVNLTNPESHAAVSKAALEAGKHVYSEKPLSMSLASARDLVELAESRRLCITGAPCGILGEAAQCMWKAVREGRIGRPLLAVAEISDGFLHRRAFRSWRNRLGVPWPYENEVKVGCVLEHAGYSLTWFAAMFGPARFITTFAACLVPNPFGDVSTATDARETTATDARQSAPDHSIGCLEFDSGVVARVTCSIIAPSDRSFTVVGEEGVLRVADSWKYDSAVFFTPHSKRSLRFEKHPWIRRVLLAGPRRLSAVRSGASRFGYRGNHRMDFARGIAELAESIEQSRPCRLSPRMVLHVTELALALHEGERAPGRRRIDSSFESMEPMPWARSAVDTREARDVHAPRALR